MEDVILLSQLNDFIFCPVSIYFHNLYGETERTLYQSEVQIAGTKAHEAIDTKRYSTSKDVIMSLEVYSEEYKIAGKIDLFDKKTGSLIERKKKIKVIYDGYIFQLYGQYFALKEMGYHVRKLQLYSLDDNKKYDIPFPEADAEMFNKFKKLIEDMRTFDMSKFEQTNHLKCQNCIYEPACDRGLV